MLPEELRWFENGQVQGRKAFFFFYQSFSRDDWLLQVLIPYSTGYLQKPGMATSSKAPHHPEHPSTAAQNIGFIFAHLCSVLVVFYLVEVFSLCCKAKILSTRKPREHYANEVCVFSNGGSSWQSARLRLRWLVSATCANISNVLHLTS